MIRWIKALLVCQVAFYFSLVVFGNVTDFSSNFNFVQHVLKMDTTFLSPDIMWRAISNPILHKIAYISIILVELIAAVFLWIGGVQLLASCGKPDLFLDRKAFANVGLFIGISLFFFGFIIIGGEWFAMWQSSAYDGVEAAARFVFVQLITLLFLNQKES